jgi:hypothetical protein
MKVASDCLRLLKFEFVSGFFVIHIVVVVVYGLSERYPRDRNRRGV